MVGQSDLDHKFYGNQVKTASGLSLDDFRTLKHAEEREFLETALKAAGGNKAEAARRLGITDNHLRYLLKP